MSPSTVQVTGFHAGGGKTAALMPKCDWSKSPLGPPETWPQSLRSIASLLLHSQFPMFVAWGPELGLLYNDAYSVLLGDKHPAALGSRFKDVWAEVWDDVLPSIELALQGKATYHENLALRMNRQGFDEDTWFTFSYSPVFDESGKVAGMFCTVTETTEEVLAQRHRLEEVERLRRLFQQAPGIIAVLREPEHIYEIANDAYLRLVGRDNPVGKTVREVLPELEEQGFLDLLDQVYETGVPYVGHETPVALRRRAQGPLEIRFVNFVFQPTFDRRGNVRGIFIEGYDVTESVKAHRALQESENELKAENRRKDEFLAMLAHELRNPLAPITTAAQLLRMHASTDGLVRKTSDIIQRQAGHMTKLVDDLLDVSRVTRGLVKLQQQSLDLRSLLTDAQEQILPLMDGKRQNFRMEMTAEPIWVRGDRTCLIQVFANILNNASRYTPEGGNITLRVDRDAEHLVVTIEDDGTGISPSLLPHIFDLFTQADRSPDRAQGGLGLGLVLVKKLLELHGGEVSAQSAGVGKGSRFIVRLPGSEIASLPAQASLNPLFDGAAKRCALVVDDNKDAADMLQALLQAAGHEAYVAYSASEALAFAHEASPSLLFLDIGLPDLDGYELARRLRLLPQTRRSTLVAVTGYGKPEDREQALQAGFDHHLVKPAGLAHVLDLLRNDAGERG